MRQFTLRKLDTVIYWELNVGSECNMEWFKISVICSFCCLCSAMSNSEIEDFRNFLEKTSQLDQIFVKKGVIPDVGYDDDELISDHAWEDSGKFEGDLILNERQRRIIVEDVAEGLSRNGIKDITKRWPDNELIYYIHREHFTSDQVQAIQDGIDDLAQASCVKFRPYRKGDRDAVVIQGSRRGCFSNVGYQGGYQILNLNGRHPPGRGCFRHGTIVHELLHSLGFYHMQSSPDRDDYIDVKWENIHQPARHNFRKYNTFSVSDFGVGYDYESVLHYSRRAFSVNGKDTLVPKQSGASIGQRTGLSDKDSQKLNKMYCDNSDSNNFEAADEAHHETPVKKKKTKNIPFQGHGIGYHQGKTIVIKLPAAQTVKVEQIPTFHLFGPFSKTSQSLPPEAVEGIGVGQKVTQEYKPMTLKVKNHDTTVKTPTQEKNSEPEKETFDDYGHEDYDYYLSPYAKEENRYKFYNDEIPIVTKSLKKNLYNKSLEKFKDEGQKNEKSTGNVSDSVDEAFDRLAKIIKTHVYPSQTPNLEIYKAKKDYSDVYDYKRDFKTDPVIAKLDMKFPSIIIPTRENIQGKGDSDDKINSSNKESDYKVHDEKRKETIKDPKSSEGNSNVEVFDSSYGTSFPLKKMPIAEDEHLVTPEYAKFENLAKKHDYSGLYYGKESVTPRKVKHALLGYLLPVVNNDWVDKDDIKKDNEKYDREAYSYSPDSTHEPVISSKIIQYEPDRPDAKGIFGRTPTGKAYSLFGVLVPFTQSWYRVDYDEPHSLEYSIEQPDDYR